MHTPGPWEVREVGQSWIEILGNPDREGSRPVVGTALPTQYVHLGKGEEQWANAKLMAAAPEMLDLLETLVQNVDSLACAYGEHPGWTAGMRHWQKYARELVARVKDCGDDRDDRKE